MAEKTPRTAQSYRAARRAARKEARLAAQRKERERRLAAIRSRLPGQAHVRPAKDPHAHEYATARRLRQIKAGRLSPMEGSHG